MPNDRWKAGLLGLALLAGLGVIFPLLMAARIPLTDPDEGKIASIAQKMVESGDWIVPRLPDEPFLERPILYFWAIAASLKIFGMSEAAVRLPGLLFGMLGTLTTTALATRMLGRRTGLIAGLFYASMVLPLALVQLPGYDAALVTCVNLALLCLWESDCGGRAPCTYGRPRAWAWTGASGVVLGLAILTKGLVGVVLVGIAYGGYLIVSKQLRPIHGLRAALCLTVAAFIASWWYLAMERSNPGYLRYYFVERHMLGVLATTQPHGEEPWWYYFPVLLAGGMPWIGYLPVLVRDAVSRWRSGIPAVSDSRGNRPVWLLGCWLVGCVFFFQVSHSKFVTYVWPVFPAIAILTAIVWSRKLNGELTAAANRWLGRAVWSTCLLGPFCLPVALAMAQIALRTRFSPAAWALVIVAGLTSLLPLWSWLRGRDRLTLGLGVATVCVQLTVLLLCALPQVGTALSARDLAFYLNRTGKLPSKILVVREQFGSVAFYLDRDLRSKLSGQLVSQGIDKPLPAVAGTEEWIVVPERRLPLAANFCDLSSLPYEQAGRFRLYRLSDMEPPALAGRANPVNAPLLR